MLAWPGICVRLRVWVLAVAALATGWVMATDTAGAGELVGAVWLAEDIRGGGVVDRVQSTVSIDAAGKLTGSGGCNRLFGSATVAGDSIVFGGIGSTRMACAPAVMDQERKFLAALADTRTFRFQGATLHFHGADGTELIRFTQLR
jgi:putative lipoprotein